jgi:hypothetical protein
MVHHMSEALPGSHSVSLNHNKYYTHHYDTVLTPANGITGVFTRRPLAGPWLLGRLASQAHGFIYLGKSGFLTASIDHRRSEFAFLKRRGKRIVCYFAGNDIRSPKLMAELERTTGVKNIASFLLDARPDFGTAVYENHKKEIARVADEFADVIFNATVDQLSYLTKPTQPFLYFYPESGFMPIGNRYENLDRPLIVHAPTSPLIKGTPHVREAVARLQQLGYEFEYVEIMNMTNDVVLETLSRAHIVLNEFYAFVPGMFGIEAMASGCALLNSADERIETDLPSGSNEAWKVTRVEEIFDNLRELLDHKELIKPLAIRGQAWARENALASKSAERFRQALL